MLDFELKENKLSIRWRAHHAQRLGSRAVTGSPGRLACTIDWRQAIGPRQGASSTPAWPQGPPPTATLHLPTILDVGGTGQNDFFWVRGLRVFAPGTWCKQKSA